MGQRIASTRRKVGKGGGHRTKGVKRVAGARGKAKDDVKDDAKSQTSWLGWFGGATTPETTSETGGLSGVEEGGNDEYEYEDGMDDDDGNQLDDFAASFSAFITNQ